jgi:hypothetical protein
VFAPPQHAGSASAPRAGKCVSPTCTEVYQHHVRGSVSVPRGRRWAPSIRSSEVLEGVQSAIIFASAIPCKPVHPSCKGVGVWAGGRGRVCCVFVRIPSSKFPSNSFLQFSFSQFSLYFLKVRAGVWQRAGVRLLLLQVLVLALVQLSAESVQVPVHVACTSFALCTSFCTYGLHAVCKCRNSTNSGPAALRLEGRGSCTGGIGVRSLATQIFG